MIEMLNLYNISLNYTEQKQFELERLLVAANQSLEAESQNSASFQKRFSLSGNYQTVG